MFDLGKLAKVVEERISPIFIESEKCCKSRSPLSKCTLCEEICPNNSISIKNKKINLENSCIECGLCASVCPTSAISIQEPMELSLYNKIQKIGVNQGTVVLGCNLNSKLTSKALKVPCIGALTLPFLLAISLSDFPVHVVYDKDVCKDCSVTNGLKIYIDRMKQVKSLQEKTGTSTNRIQHSENPPKIKSPKLDKTKIDYDRRKLFNLMFDQVKQVPDTLVKEFLGSKSLDKGKTVTQVPSIKVNHLKLLKIYLDNINIDGLENEELDSFYRPYAVDKCQFCRACTILCPVGALQYIDKESKILLKEGLCTGCGLCVDVCYYKTLKLGTKKINNFKKDKTVELINDEKSL